MKDLKYIFGPIPSRRLGRSLGINAVPSKICSMNCLYCEVGKTKALTVARKPYIRAADIITELRENYYHFKDNIDVITVTGAGEPTLNSELREILNGVKSISDKPVAILTNSTLLYDKEVFNTLLDFDIVVPSLDGVTDRSFKDVTLVHDSISIKDVIKNLKVFSKQYKGKLLLEILFCKGINDGENEIEKMAEILKDIKTDKVQIGTITRPPAFSEAKPIDDEKMLEIAKYFISKAIPAEATGGFKEIYKNVTDHSDLKSLLESISKMRPCTIEDFVAVFGEKKETINVILSKLLKEKKIISENFNGYVYYCNPSISTGNK